MPGRDLCDDPAAHDLICQFPSGPVANGALFRLRTWKPRSPRPGLLCRDLAFPPGTRLIASSRLDGPIGHRGGSFTQPAFAPGSHGLRGQTQFPGDLAVVFPCIGFQHDPGSQRDLLGSRVPSHQTLQLPAFVFRQARTRAGFGPLIFGSPSSSGSRPSLLRGIDMESRTQVSESVG